MTKIIGGNITEGPKPLLPATARFVGFLDVLGMKAWVQQDGPDEVARRLEAAVGPAIGARDWAINDSPVGPFIDVSQFSDSMILFTLDDSWASLLLLVRALKQTTVSALEAGVPLRGAIATGEAVCDPANSRFVGQPIVEAFVWECQSWYRGVGVQFTPDCHETLLKKFQKEPLPPELEYDLGTDALSKVARRSYHLIWLKSSDFEGIDASAPDLLFVDHWPGYLARLPDVPLTPQQKETYKDVLSTTSEGLIKQHFDARGLPEPSNVPVKRRQSTRFLDLADEARIGLAKSEPAGRSVKDEVDFYARELSRLDQLRVDLEARRS